MSLAVSAVNFPAASSKLQPHQQRVVEERMALEIRLNALGVFMKSNTYEKLHAAERMRLARQFNHMTDYSLVLAERIAAFA